MIPIKRWPVWAMGLFAATSLPGDDVDDQHVIELEAFIVEETAQTQPETLSPLSVRLDSFFGGERTVAGIPRSVTVLSPELMELLQIDSYESLDRYGAGTQRVNYFGLAGSAFLRGARAGTYFNGMLRAYQRNEMPMSFGSLEGLEIIKGPVPAGFSPTLVGGAVNQRPKTPFFDRRRGALEAGIGSWDEFHLQLDYGEPLLLLDRPAAYRISYTGHRAERYYENVPHDYDSFYGALKVKLSERNRLFVAGEYYDFRSSEIPGINRPTPELIRDRSYVIGESPDLTSPEWGGSVARTLLEFPYSLVVNPSLFALAVPGDVARSRIEPGLLGFMLDLRDPAVLESLYTTRPAGEVPGFAAWAIEPAGQILDGLDPAPVDAYLYTPAYFEAGGDVLTEKLQPDRVLADPDDRADSRDYLFSGDLETRLDADNRLLSRFFLERLITRKASTYGFAMNTDQLILNGRLEWRHESPGTDNQFTAGLDLRYAEATMVQDFDAEPFSRRDLTRGSISPNSIVPAGGQTGPDGRNFWSSFGNASQASEVFQAGLYAGGVRKILGAVDWHYGIRLDHAWWETGLPAVVDGATPEQRAGRRNAHDTALWQVHLNPHWELLPGIHAYGAVQLGKALSPGDGGTISGEESFTDVELFEGGLKAALLDGRLYTALSAYHWDQATFSNRDAAARPLRAKGIEWEATWSPSERLTLMGAFTAQRVYLRTNTLGFGAIPQSEQGWALNGGVLNAAAGREAPDNPEMAFAGVPEVSAHLYASLELPGGLSIAGGPIWRDAYFHDMQRAMRIPSHVLWNAQLRYDAEDWWIRLHVDNLFDEFYWIGQEPIFSAGTLILQGTPRRYRLAAGIRF